VGLGSLCEDGHESGIFVTCSSEENEGWLLLTENGFDFILREFKNGWDHQWLDESGEGIFRGFAGEWHDFLLKSSEESKSWSGDSVLGTASGGCVDECDLLLILSVRNVDTGVESISLLSKESNNELRVLRLLLELIASD